MGPMGPRGLGPWALWAPGALGPTPFRLCRRALQGFFGKNSVPKTNYAYLLKNDVCLYIFAMLANVDSNLKLKICKIAI